MGWWPLLIVSGVLALVNGIDVFTALVWGKVDAIRGAGGFGIGTPDGPIEAKFEPELFKRRFARAVVVFLFSTAFFVVGVFALN
jgi:hypothetical protein